MKGGVGKSIESSVGLRSDWCRGVSGVRHKEERGVAGHVSGSGVEAIGRSGCFGRVLDKRQNSSDRRTRRYSARGIRRARRVASRSTVAETHTLIMSSGDPSNYLKWHLVGT